MKVGYDLALEDRLANETTVLIQNYKLPDGRVIRFGRERFMAPECLFQPNLVELDGYSKSFPLQFTRSYG